MTRSASKPTVSAVSTPKHCTSSPSVAPRRRTVVRLGDLDIAPENLRYDEVPDEGIAQLADTIAAAGLLQLPTVRPGRDGEAAHMVLDGRRRLLALRLLRDGGVVDDDHPVEVFVETDKARQSAAVILTNTAVPVHVADVIAAIGRMLKARLGVKAIARALGYGEIEIRRLAALSALPAVALDMLKTGQISLRQARLLARLKDADAQTALVQAVLDGHGLPEWRIQEGLGEGRLTDRDPRCGLVTPDLYAAEGGRTEVDLFGEMPSILLDPEALTRAWLKQAAQTAATFEEPGLTVYLRVADDEPNLPNDLELLGYAYGGLSDEATLVYRAARDQAQAAAEAVMAMIPETAGDGRTKAVEAFVRARIAQDQAGAGQRLVTVLILRPSLRTGVEVEGYGPVEPARDQARSRCEASDELAPELASELAPDLASEKGRAGAHSPYAPPRAETPAPEVEGVSHILHATRTDTATRGLIRALADVPEVALSVLVARLFGSMMIWPPIGRPEAALAITATVFNPTGGRIIAGLDGVVRERLDERRRAWEASGLTMIAWVHAMDPVERMGLLAELTALSLDLHETRSDLVRTVARAEAAEIADLCDANLAQWWTPDGAYLRPHSREQLLTMLESMGAETQVAVRLKKGDLVVWTQDQAQTRNWAPACLSWSLPAEDAADRPGAEATEAKTAEADIAEGDAGPEAGGALCAVGEASDAGADREATTAGARRGAGNFVVTPAGEAALAGAGLGGVGGRRGLIGMPVSSG